MDAFYRATLSLVEHRFACPKPPTGEITEKCDFAGGSESSLTEAGYKTTGASLKNVHDQVSSIRELALSCQERIVRPRESAILAT
jgi:hypothetical protein